MKQDPAHRPRDTFGLAGWLFADLSLALALLFAASVLPLTATEEPEPSPSSAVAATRRPSGTSAPALVPTPEPTLCRRTAVLRKHEVIVRATSIGSRPTSARLLAPFAKYSNQQVGLLLTYGHGRNPAAGEAIAAQANRIIRDRIPEQVTERTIVEAFFNQAGPLGSVTFDIYLLADDC